MQVIQAVADVTLNDSANAPKPVGRLKKSDNDKPREVTWDGFQDDDFDIVEEVDADGTKHFIYKKKKKCSKPQTDNIDDRPGIVYPEIIWYFVSHYLRPEQILNFSLLCKDTYAITRTEKFWRNMYEKYCIINQQNLPERLKIENDNKVYGLRQRVIRALYHTYMPFLLKLTMLSFTDPTLHKLEKRRCVNVWYSKGPCKWFIYFKLKRVSLERPASPANFIEELGRIDANPDDETKLLKVSCKTFQDVPPVMGMILSSVTMDLPKGFRYNRLVLGFNTSYHTSRDTQPDYTVVLDSAASIIVYDWWNPMYPHFDDDALPSCDRDSPVLDDDFFEFDEDI